MTTSYSEILCCVACSLQSPQDRCGLADMDIKEETVKKTSCAAVHLGGWHAGFEGELSHIKTCIVVA